MGVSPAAGVSAVVARGTEQDASRFTLEDIGWNGDLSKRTGIDEEAVAELLPVVVGSWENPRGIVGHALHQMRHRQREQDASSSTPTENDMIAHTTQIRTQLSNLKRRRAEFLNRRAENTAGAEVVVRSL